MHQLFGGRLRSRVHCLACGHNSDTFDSILDVSLDLASGRASSLKDALENLVRKDKLSGQNKYKCEKCVMRCPVPLGPVLPLSRAEQSRLTEGKPQVQEARQRREELHD